MASNRVKQIITVDQRISLFQTAMNNAGRNFEGKRVPVKRMANFATDFYKLSIAEISEIGKMELSHLEKMLVPEKKVQKAVRKADVTKLINRAKNHSKRRVK